MTVRGARPRSPFDVAHALDDRRSRTVRAFADRFERSRAGRTDWTAPAAQRLRFVPDFGYATGPRAHEFVSATVHDIGVEARSTWWLNVTGKGKRPGRVALPPLARDALRGYLRARGLPVIRARWDPPHRR